MKFESEARGKPKAGDGWTAYSPEFEAVWSSWPKDGVDKAAAFEMWKDTVRWLRVEHDRTQKWLADRAQSYAQHFTGGEGDPEQCPPLIDWLRREMFMDEANIEGRE